ncbi:MAG: LacI family DNA-binding transcriptional regulator [Anaerolineae bacterium]|nr:LacI family DNA-binding transcriptional regulator [Anaerolineae bacterium]
MSQRRVTIVEIAKEAGVSAQTVSRVVNGHTNVAPETRDKIQEIIDRRGYHPSRLARSLLRGRSHTVGVVGYGLGLFGPSYTLAGIVREANKEGYSVLPNMSTEPEIDDPTSIIGELIEYHVDGIIWAVPEIGNNHDWIETVLPEHDIPFVFLSMANRPNLTTVAIDNYTGGQMAAQHLIDKGRRHLGLLKGPSDWWEARERARGWYDTLHANGLTVDENLVLQGDDWSAAEGERCMRELLQRKHDIDAVFIGNDSMAIGALKTTREFGLKVPDDIAVIGFDDVPEAAYIYPSLTTVQQNLTSLGCRALAELDRLIKADDADWVSSAASIVIQPQLIIRDSA